MRRSWIVAIATTLLFAIALSARVDRARANEAAPQDQNSLVNTSHRSGRELGDERVVVLLDSSQGNAEPQPDATRSATEAAKKTTDPLARACPHYVSAGSHSAAFDALQKGEDFAHIEGDGVMGMGNMGHTLEALSWYCKAAAGGNGTAAYYIGDIFENGFVVNSVDQDGQIHSTDIPADKAVALFWYKKAAALKYAPAMKELAYGYFWGPVVFPGFAKDAVKGLRYAEEAGNLGNTDAQLMLMTYYAEGKPKAPLSKSTPLALKWYGKALAGVTRNAKICADPNIVKSMISILPDASVDPSTVRSSLKAVQTSDEFKCVLSIGQQATDPNETAASELVKLFSGGMMGSWEYTVEFIPGTNRYLIRRQTLADAAEEGIENLAPIFDAMARARQH